MTKLHEILAVEADRKSAATKLIQGTNNDFKNKQSHYTGFVRTYKKDNEDYSSYPDENKEMVTSVQSKLKYMIPYVCDAIDVTLTKEEGNSTGKAVAELVVDGVKFGTFSATSLLSLESKLKEIRSMYDNIPTLDPAKKWKWNEDYGYWETVKEEITIRTEKVVEGLVLYPATEQHPAQTDKISRDKRVGEYHTTHFSGMVTPKQKALAIGRIDKLIDAVKLARAQANNIEVKNVKVGEEIFNYINGLDIDTMSATIDSFNIETS